jgi:hypothetical protein
MGGSNSKVVDNITGAGRRQVAASSAVAERRFVTILYIYERGVVNSKKSSYTLGFFQKNP